MLGAWTGMVMEPPGKKNNKGLNFVLKIAAGGDFLCRILVNFMLKSLLVEIFVIWRKTAFIFDFILNRGWWRFFCVASQFVKKKRLLKLT